MSFDDDVTSICSPDASVRPGVKETVKVAAKVIGIADSVERLETWRSAIPNPPRTSRARAARLARL